MIALKTGAADMKEQTVKVMSQFEKYEKYLAERDGTFTPIEIEKAYKEQCDLQVIADEE
jgi:hypothetical protein